MVGPTTTVGRHRANVRQAQCHRRRDALSEGLEIPKVPPSDPSTPRTTPQFAQGDRRDLRVEDLHQRENIVGRCP